MGTVSVNSDGIRVSSPAGSQFWPNSESLKPESREVLVCGHCGRGQYNRGRESCVACHRSLLIALEPLCSDAGVRTHGVIYRQYGSETCGKLKELRRALEISQPELASAAGCVRTYISRYESGDIVPTLKSLMRIAQAFNLSLGELFDTRLTVPDLALLSMTRSPQSGPLMAEIAECLPRLGELGKDLLLRAISSFAAHTEE